MRQSRGYCCGCQSAQAPDWRPATRHPGCGNLFRVRLCLASSHPLATRWEVRRASKDYLGREVEHPRKAVSHLLPTNRDSDKFKIISFSLYLHTIIHGSGRKWRLIKFDNIQKYPFTSYESYLGSSHMFLSFNWTTSEDNLLDCNCF